MAKKSRVPSTTVDLVLILGRILRDHLKFEITETECWTFEHVANWDIPVEAPEDGADQSAWEHYEWRSIRGEHEMSVHLGSGHCWARPAQEGNPTKLELRVRCELGEWVPASMSMWDFQFWIMMPDRSISRHHYQCYLGYGDDRDIMEIPLSKERFPAQPPRKIAFWREKESQTSR